jgi:putative spermidine/putrescine transport system permease protein
VLCILIAVPFAFFMARVAPRRMRALLVAAVLVPLWASYLVKAYAWRAMLQPNGVLDSVLGDTPGYGMVAVVLTLTYLWLPYMILPVYSGFDRLPEAHLEASADLGGKTGTTFRRIVLPAVRPSIVAGSIFTFSLSLGDYIAVQIVGGKLQVLGTAVLRNVVLDLPFAAALGTASVVIMVIYLMLAGRTGALDNL